MLWLIPGRLKSSKIDVNKNIDHIGQLLTPRTWKLNQLAEYPLNWAGDNDCFTGRFNRDDYIRWLGLASIMKDRCLFVTCPDVVSDAYTTLKQFSEWQPIISNLGYKPALVLQNGIENTTIPWDYLEAVFVGGDTKFKMSQQVISLLIEAGKRGKWRHVGRVNSLKRMRHFWNYADSFDGTDYVHHPIESVNMYLPAIYQKKQQVVMNI